MEDLQSVYSLFPQAATAQLPPKASGEITDAQFDAAFPPQGDKPKASELFKPKAAALPKATDLFGKPSESAIAQIGAREGRLLDQAGTGIKNALTKPLTEKGNPVAKIGEVGGRAADMVSNLFSGVVSPLAATAGQVLKPVAKPLATYVAGKMGGTPEQAKEVGGKLEGSTADVLGTSLANAAAGAAGGTEAAAKVAPTKEIKPLPVIEKPPVAKPLEAATSPKTVSDALYRMSNKDVARRADAANTLKTIKGVDNATWEKLYAYKDNPEGVQLTPQEQALYIKHIEPVAKRSDYLRTELNKKGVPFEEGAVGGAPRKVKGKNPLVERIYGSKAGEKAARTGSKLSTFAPTLQARQMWALPGKVGERPIVFIKDGQILKNGELVGELPEGGRPTAGTETSAGKLQQATTEEIEKATKLEYHKNLLANEYLNWQSLERANDAADFLEASKKDPGFLDFAAPPVKGRSSEVPSTWRALQTDIKAFDGWKFDPHMAEVFEDYLGNIKSPEEFTRGAMNVAKAMKASIFYNPIRHMVNATNMFGTSLGAVKGATALVTGKLPAALARATKSVLTQDKAFRTAMEEGLSAPGMHQKAAQFNQELMRAMGRSVQSDPAAFARLAKQWGYKSTVGLVQGLYKGSSKLLWSYSDILTMARYNLYRGEGLSPREAVAKTHQVMADYRVPSRVAGSRGASQLLQDPRATMFGRYDYNRMANIAGTAKRAAKNDKEGWEARDQVLALAMITTVGYKIVDKWLQKATDDPNAHYSMGGYSSLYDIGQAVGDERKSPSQAAMSAFSPGLLSTPVELATGQNLYTGAPIMQRGDLNSFIEGGQRGTDASRMGYDLANYLAGKFAPVAAAQGAVTNEDPAQKIIAEQLGASFPKDNSKALKYESQAARKAGRKRPSFVP